MFHLKSTFPVGSLENVYAPVALQPCLKKRNLFYVSQELQGLQREGYTDISHLVENFSKSFSLLTAPCYTDEIPVGSCLPVQPVGSCLFFQKELNEILRTEKELKIQFYCFYTLKRHVHSRKYG